MAGTVFINPLSFRQIHLAHSALISENSDTPNNMNVDVDNNSGQGDMTNEKLVTAIGRVLGALGYNLSAQNMEQEDMQFRPIKIPRSRKLAMQTHQDRQRNGQERKT
jgi:hypothetical protein